MYPEITAAELGEKLKSDEAFVLLDVREPVELGYAKIADPRLENVPMSALSKQGLRALPEAVRAGQRPCMSYVITEAAVRRW
jgi:rhodanese-related sulfurtransferase